MGFTLWPGPFDSLSSVNKISANSSVGPSQCSSITLTRSAAEVTEYTMEEGNDANNEENFDDSIYGDDQKLIVENEEGKKMKKTILDHLGILLFSIGISIIVLTVKGSLLSIIIYNIIPIEYCVDNSNRFKSF